MNSLKRLQEPRAVGELLPAVVTQQGRGRQPWPHGTILTADPALLVAESVWRRWWQLHTAGRDREAGQAMARIHRTFFQPIDLFALWGEARRAHEPELADAIFGVLELRAAEEEGRVNSGAWSEPEPTRVEARREDRRKEPIL